jgi:hypothetical protein
MEVLCVDGLHIFFSPILNSGCNTRKCGISLCENGHLPAGLHQFLCPFVFCMACMFLILISMLIK